jgi:hypothetical protein
MLRFPREKMDYLVFIRLKLALACIIVNKRKSLKIGAQIKEMFLRETTRYRDRESIQSFMNDVSGTTLVSDKI